MLPCHGPKPLKNFYKTSLKVLYEELHQRVPVRTPDLSSTSILSSYRGKRRAIHSYLCLCFTQWSMPTLGWIKLAKLSWIFPVPEKISSFGVCLQILLCFQPSPSFKSTSYSDPFSLTLSRHIQECQFGLLESVTSEICDPNNVASAYIYFLLRSQPAFPPLHCFIILWLCGTRKWATGDVRAEPG